MFALRRTSKKILTKNVRLFPRSPLAPLSYSFHSSEPTQPSTTLFSTQYTPTQHDDFTNYLASNNSHINSYMKKLYKYLTSASILGISSAYLLAATVPTGLPSAFLILAGFGLEHYGTDYIEKTKSITYSYRDTDGLLKYGTKNSWKRKLAFVSSCVGYGCIVSAFMSMSPLPTTALCLSILTCLFSKLGHMGYCTWVPKPLFKPSHLLLSGLFTGIVGLNMITTCSEMFMLENPLLAPGTQLSTYIGLMLYNVFTGHDSQKTIEDVHKGKGDYLLHGNKFSENWLYALIPQFLMNLY